MKQGVTLIGKVGDDDVWPSIIVVIVERHAHAGERSTVCIDRCPGKETCLFERAVSIVVLKKFDHRIIRDKDVWMPIAIEVGDRDSEAFARF